MAVRAGQTQESPRLLSETEGSGEILSAKNGSYDSNPTRQMDELPTLGFAEMHRVQTLMILGVEADGRADEIIRPAIDLFERLDESQTTDVRPGAGASPRRGFPPVTAPNRRRSQTPSRFRTER